MAAGGGDLGQNWKNYDKQKPTGKFEEISSLGLALWLAAVVAFLNIAMTLILLAIYLGTYRKIRSTFTMGLVLFGSFFVVLNLAILVFWLFLYENSAATLVDQASAYMLLINIGEALALVNLLRVTWK